MLIQLFHLVLRKKLAAYQQALLEPAQAQRARLRAVLCAGAATAFGREHGLRADLTPDEYRSLVPVRPYAALAPWIERMKNGERNVLTPQQPEMFGVTSGSSAQPKFIPQPRAFTNEHHFSHLIWIYNMLRDHPGSVGRTFSMISPAEEGVTAGGIPYGSSSGKQYRDQNIPVRMMHAVPYEVFLSRNCHAKYHAALVYALGADLRTVNSVNPSTLVLLGQLLGEQAPELLDDLGRGALNHAPGLSDAERTLYARRLRARPERRRQLLEIYRSEGCLLPRHVWPNIRVVNTWQGGNAPFYLPLVRELWGDVPQRCLGLRATEGIFNIPLCDNTASGPLAVCSHFLEFSEGEGEPQPGGRTLLAHELEVGRRYRLIITTSAGLYRYDLADIIEVTGMRGATPEVAFLHKAGGVLSLTGEKVCEDQLVAAMATVAKQTRPITGFSVTVEMAQPPRYVLAMEPAPEECAHIPLPNQMQAASPQTLELLQQMGHVFDCELARLNIEYAAKRESGRLAAPAVLLLAPGTYREHRLRLVAEGRPDGQIKPPHILKPAGPGTVPVPGCAFFDHARVLARAVCDESAMPV